MRKLWSAGGNNASVCRILLLYNCLKQRHTLAMSELRRTHYYNTAIDVEIREKSLLGDYDYCCVVVLRIFVF